MASAMEKQGYEVHEEVPTLTSEQANWYHSYWQTKEKAYVIDPTVRIEFNTSQPQAVHAEKQSIYNPCCEDLQPKYNLNFPIEVIALMVGSRGTIPPDFHSLVDITRRFIIYILSSYKLYFITVSFMATSTFEAVTNKLVSLSVKEEPQKLLSTCRIFQVV
jgi:hypothetical protein